MLHKRYHVVFYGEILEGYSGKDVRQNLASQYKLDSKTRNRLFAGQAVIIRQNADYMTASILRSNCESQGAVCHIELVSIKTSHGTIDISRLCNVVFRGETVLGHRLEDVKTKLQARLNVDDETIDQLFSGKPLTIKHEVDYEAALQIQSVFEQAGAVCRITSSDKALPPDKTFKEEVFRPSNLAMMICPKCGLKQPATQTCEQCGIAVLRFIKKQQPVRNVSKRQTLKQRDAAYLLPAEKSAEKELYEEIEEEYEEAIPEPEEFVPREIPIWQIVTVGNAIITALATLFGVSFYKLLIRISLAPTMHDINVEYTNVWDLLFSNVQITGLAGIFFGVAMFVQRLLRGHHKKALRFGFVPVLLVPLGAALCIDVFVSAIRGVEYFVFKFVFKALILSAIAYGIGWLCFVPVRLKNASMIPAPENEGEEFFEDEEAEGVDEEESESENTESSN